LRKFRFRIWNKENKEMYLSPVEVEHLGSWFDAHLPGSLANKNNIVIMQSTGLTDIDGGEVFEGDILVRECFCNFYIGWKEGCFVKIPCEKVQRANWSWYPVKQNNIKYWKICGNIYQNPNFIEEYII
jgi:uncharacterized phage protein (TIGR01671 family)